MTGTGIKLLIEPSPSAQIKMSVASRYDRNPLYSVGYVQFREHQGYKCRLIALMQGDRIISALYIFTFNRVVLRPARIFSLPDEQVQKDGQLEKLWEGVETLCRKLRLSSLEIQSACNIKKIPVPIFGKETDRVKRFEYFLELTPETDIWSGLSSNHKRNCKKAIKSNITLARGLDKRRCRIHCELIDESRVHRVSRGNSDYEPPGMSNIWPMLESGAGEILQAEKDGEVVSSILLLRSAAGAYYQSAGTTNEGRASGASQWLIWRSLQLMRTEGVTYFSLGGAGGPSTGLGRFKQSFGSNTADLENVEFFLSAEWKRSLFKAALIIRRNPRQAWRLAIDRDHFRVFSANPALILRNDSGCEAVMRRLSSEDINTLRADPRGERRRQAERFDQHPPHCAYGLIVSGELVHVAWLFLQSDRLGKSRENVLLQENEAEITHCYTFSEYRGQGFYVQAIRALCETAAEQGVRRVLMTAGKEKTASIQGIKKAGLTEQGAIMVYHPPWAPSAWSVKFRKY